jgi:hypothetical protein
MIEVQSGDVTAMRDATVADLVDDINKKQAQLRLGIVAPCCLAVIGVLALLQFSSSGQSVWATVGTVALLAALPAWAIGEWFDSYMRTSVLLYNLEGATETAYRKVTEGFDALAACHGKWHIASGGAVRDLTTWKRNAGAAHLVDRRNARLAYSLPKILRSNVTPPAITLGSRTFFFLPEVMLVKHGRRFGAVGYDDLQIRTQTSHFIEDGAPLTDAQVVGHTWKHPNKDGGPDRRFGYNRQLPICLYDVMLLASSSGVNELLEFSRTGLVQPFSMALRDLPHRQAPDSVGSIALLRNSVIPERNDPTIPESSAHQSPDRMLLAGIAALIAAGIAVVAVYALHGTTPISMGTHGAVTDLPSVPTTAATHQNRTPPTEIIMQKPGNVPSQPGLPSLSMVTVRTPANLRSGPSSSATVIRVAGSGEKFNVFGRANGWVQVGTDKPLGWIAASLLAE